MAGTTRIPVRVGCAVPVAKVALAGRSRVGSQSALDTLELVPLADYRLRVGHPDTTCRIFDML